MSTKATGTDPSGATGKKRKPRSGKNTRKELTGATKEDNVYVKLNVRCATYTENVILDEGRLMYDPTVRDPDPHDPLAGTFGSLPTASPDSAAVDGRIFCYNEFDEPTREEKPPAESWPGEDTGLHSGNALLGTFHKGKWLERTSVKCWWCCNSFDCTPVGAPLKYDEMSDRFDVLGCFCSFPCASAYMRNDQKRLLADKLYLLHMLWERVPDEEGEDGVEGRQGLLPAPPREMLDMFGGPLTVEQFREASGKGKHFRLNVAPQLVPVEMMGEDMTQGRRGGLLQALKQAGGSSITSAERKKKTTAIDQLIVPVNNST